MWVLTTAEVEELTGTASAHKASQESCVQDFLAPPTLLAARCLFAPGSFSPYKAPKTNEKCLRALALKFLKESTLVCPFPEARDLSPAAGLVFFRAVFPLETQV